MPPRTQQQLDAAVDRQHTFAVEISPDAPLPQNRQVYDPLRQLPATGFDSLLKSTNARRRKTRVFQGIRDDVYFAGSQGEPFSHDLLTGEEIRAIRNSIDRPVSLFPDGSIQIFEQTN